MLRTTLRCGRGLVKACYDENLTKQYQIRDLTVGLPINPSKQPIKESLQATKQQMLQMQCRMDEIFIQVQRWSYYV